MTLGVESRRINGEITREVFHLLRSAFVPFHSNAVAHNTIDCTSDRWRFHISMLTGPPIE
jgi:hypothetical protein